MFFGFPIQNQVFLSISVIADRETEAITIWVPAPDVGPVITPGVNTQLTPCRPYAPSHPGVMRDHAQVPETEGCGGAASTDPGATTFTSLVSTEKKAQHVQEVEPYNGPGVIHSAGVHMSFTHPAKQGRRHRKPQANVFCTYSCSIVQNLANESLGITSVDTF